MQLTFRSWLGRRWNCIEASGVPASFLAPLLHPPGLDTFLCPVSDFGPSGFLSWF